MSILVYDGYKLLISKRDIQYFYNVGKFKCIDVVNCIVKVVYGGVVCGI